MTMVAVGLVLTAGTTAYGISEGKKSDEKARKANESQQREALAFQREMREKSLAEILKMQEGAEEGILASAARRKEDAMVALQRGGWDPGSSIGLGLQRGMAMDTQTSLRNLYAQMAGQRAAAYGGQEFPMIQYGTGAGAAAYAGAGQLLGDVLGYSMQAWSANNPPATGGTEGP